MVVSPLTGSGLNDTLLCFFLSLATGQLLQTKSTFLFTIHFFKMFVCVCCFNIEPPPTPVVYKVPM